MTPPSRITATPPHLNGEEFGGAADGPHALRPRGACAGDRRVLGPAGRDGIDCRCGWPRAGEPAEGPVDPAAGRPVGDGRLCGTGRGRTGGADDADAGGRGAGWWLV